MSSRLTGLDPLHVTPVTDGGTLSGYARPRQSGVGSMKKGSTPQLAAAWWNTNQPAGLTTASGLKSALAAYEVARAKLKAAGTDAGLKAAGKTLKQVERAVKAVIAEAGPLLKAKQPKIDVADVTETIKALKKCKDLYAAARDEMVDMVSEEDEAEGEFVDPENYAMLLLKALRRLRGGKPVHFAFAAGKTAPEHRLALHRTTGGRTLAGVLTRQTGLHLTTFGMASADPERATTLVLALEGKQLAGLKKKAERMLKAFRPLPFTHVALLVDGVPADDLPDPEDVDNDYSYEDDDEPASEGQDGPDTPPPPPPPPPEPATVLTQRLRGLAARIPQCDPSKKPALIAAAQAAQAHLKAGNVSGATGLVDALENAIESAGVLPEAIVAPSDGAKITFAKSRLLWDTTRKYLHQQIKSLQRTILDQANDETDFDAIRANIPRLEVALERLDTRLSDALDAIYNSDGAPSALVGETRAIALEYRAYVDSDPLMRAFDGNPFVALDAAARVRATLDALIQKL